MPKSRIIITLGALIALLPLLGFPRAWEAFFQVAAGLSIVLLSTWASIDKRLMLKAKAQARQARKIITPETPETSEPPVPFGQRVTDFYPKTAPPGRRASDLKRSEPPNEPLI